MPGLHLDSCELWRGHQLHLLPSLQGNENSHNTCRGTARLIFISSFQKAVGWGVYSSPTALYYFQCCSLTILAVRSGIQPKTRLVVCGSLKVTELQPFNTILSPPLYSTKENKTEHAEAIKSRQWWDTWRTQYSANKKEILSPGSPTYFSPKTPVCQVAGLLCSPNVS